MKVGKEEDDQQAALWLLAKKEHYRYNVCFVSVFVALEKAGIICDKRITARLKGRV